MIFKERPTHAQELSIPTKQVIELIQGAETMEDVEIIKQFISKSPDKNDNPLESTNYHTFTPNESRLISEEVGRRIKKVDLKVQSELLNLLTWLKPPEIKNVNVTINEHEDE